MTRQTYIAGSERATHKGRRKRSRSAFSIDHMCSEIGINRAEHFILSSGLNSEAIAANWMWSFFSSTFLYSFVLSGPVINEICNVWQPLALSTRHTSLWKQKEARRNVQVRRSQRDSLDNFLSIAQCWRYVSGNGRLLLIKTGTHRHQSSDSWWSNHGGWSKYVRRAKCNTIFTQQNDTH